MPTAEDNKGKNNEFGTVEKVLAVIKPLEDVERIRASDRAKIDELFNGKRPYTKDEEEKHDIQINVNWGEGKRIMRDANNQLNSALLHPGILCNFILEHGQEDKRDQWSQLFTKLIHKPIQRGNSGRKHFYLIKNRNASVCMHGIGAMFWQNPFRWMPRFAALEDLLIPTETYCDFSNLRYFCINQYLTVGELLDVQLGDKVRKGWNKKMLDGIVEHMKNLQSEGVPPTWRDQPEAMANIFKENRGFYYSDATPKIRCRWFFFQQIDDPKKWYRVLLLREAYGDVKPSQDFLFDGLDEPFASDINEILNVQYGDSNYVAPLKYHVVRGLGVDLYGPVETNNRLRCEFVQSVFEHLKMYFRIQDPSDRDRLKQIVLAQYGVLPTGLEIVKREERHEIDPSLVEEAMGQMANIMQQSSSSYLSSPDYSTEKEMTAKEATIKLNQANVMVSSMISALYMQEGFYFEEVKRRFLGSDKDPQVKQFQKACAAGGIPEDLMKPEYWRTDVNRVLGGGDKTQAQAEAMWIWSIKNDLDPSVQPQAKRLVVGTMLNDFDKAAQLVPLAKVTATSGVLAAENVFGTLMQGQLCTPRKGIDQQGYIETLLKMMSSVIDRVKQTDSMGTPDDLIGLVTVARNISEHIAILAADKKEKGVVKTYADTLGKLMNEVKAFAQRLSQHRQAQQEAMQGDPAATAKAKGIMLNAATKQKIAEANAAMKMRHKQLGFQMDEQRKNLSLIGELKRADLAHHQEVFNEGLKQVTELIGMLREQRVKESMHATNGENNSETT